MKSLTYTIVLLNEFSSKKPVSGYNLDQTVIKDKIYNKKYEAKDDNMVVSEKWQIFKCLFKLPAVWSAN